jgi:hypothetical protein
MGLSNISKLTENLSIAVQSGVNKKMIQTLKISSS